MSNELNELKSRVIGTKFISKKTGNEGIIVDLNSKSLFIEIEYPGPITISIKNFDKFIEIDDEKSELIKKITELLKTRTKEEKK